MLRIQNSFLKEKLEGEIGYPEYDKCMKNAITKLLRYLTVLTVWLQIEKFWLLMFKLSNLLLV